MAKQSMFYEEVVPITQEQHKTCSATIGADYGFARGFHALPLMMSEFHAAALDLPIVFGKSADGAYTPMAMVGLQPNDSLFINDEGRFTGRYTPAVLRRYPFVFASSADKSDQFALCIDGTAPHIDREGTTGEKFFDDDGQASEFLKKMMEFCKSYEIDLRKTLSASKDLAALELFDPMRAEVTMKDGQKVALTGFFVISRERLSALQADQVHDLFSREILELLYYHLISLKNIERLRDHTA